jgi:beta-1,4-mannosyl-glycoprotein beta-1,4-N-acetylglucosaminyltransferase
MVLEEQEQQEQQEQEYSLCLNMIVKNESHIIKDTLTKLLQKIKFDYWVISDTGSTDETCEAIIDYFKEAGIPGELYQDDWVDFSHNRNKALEYAFGKSNYLLVFDADDEICGDFVLPELTKDSYSLQFGSYTRPQIVNNYKRWKYVGVLHEYICSNDSRINDASTEIIKGPYHVVSGRTGNRNLDSNKYLKDATILEKAYHDAFNAKDDIYIRYGFYCANSYYDCGKYESAISWYKKTLENGGWSQEKYVSCLKLYNCYNNLDKKEAGFFYLVKSAEYDRERAECCYELIKYYSGSGLYSVAYGYYGVLRDFYRDTYLNNDLNNKLFVNVSISEIHLPCYVIIVCDKMRDYETGIQMYRIIFTKKCKIFDTWIVGNMLYNLQFFTAHVKEEDKTAFYSLFQEYVDFLFANNYPISDSKHQFMNTYKKYGIVVPSRRFESTANGNDCSSSKKILIYTGFMEYLWNDTYVSNNAIGGAEKAVVYLARNLPKEYEIIISGDVADEVVGNVKYVNRFALQALLDVEKFHTIIVSRYVSFFLLFPRFHCHQLYLSSHDTGFLNNFNDITVNCLIEENNKYINGVICLTTWHKLNVVQSHPCLKDKISIINNGIPVPESAFSHNKIKNKFVWTSCSSRGLDLLLKLWDKILEVMPDATLDISSYDAFPNPNRNKDEEIEKLITQYSDSVTHHGKLNTLQLHDLISKAEYWLYTCTFYETSCITALEMLMHEVVCLYYPLAGLNETIGKYGIQVIPGTEVQSIVNLSEERKAEMRINGKKYATSCSWENRAKEWASVLGLLTKTPFCDNGPDGDYYFKNNRTIIKKEWVFFCSIFFEKKMIQHYIDNLNILYADADYYIHLTSDKEAIMKSKPEKVTIVYEVFDSSIFNALPNSKFSFLNTEPLTIPYRLDNIKLIFELYKKHMDSFNYYDYSESNLRLLNDKCIGVGVDNVYLPYKCGSEELSVLQNLNKNTKKEYDFGILKTLGKEVSPRRKKIVDFLKYHNFSINIIEGWNYNDRDFELAKCKIILNIHGNLNNDVSTIFEHIRCDRLLEAGFTILSETSYDLCPEFIQKYPNLRLIEYEDFFDIGIIVDCYNNSFVGKEHNKYVLKILDNCYNKIDIPLVHISFIEKLSLEFNPKKMVIYDIGSSVLHWTQHAKVFWKNSTIYLFDAMTEMKLFYDEYNKTKNTTFEYNVGVLCDEDYKRISFYQNDELSGGNSYYKEIGHPESHNIFTENHIKHKLGMKLETVVKNKKIPLPDLIKIDVQGAELDILKGSMNVINNAKFLIVELQHVEYNKGAPLCNKTCDFLIENGWEVYAEKFSNNGPDADWCFINKNKKNNKTIVDCFTFYNELDMLTYRLNILDKVVDYFVLVESTHTHVGKEKPLFYNENKHLFKKFNHKIIHIVVDDFPHKYPNINIEKQEQWINERFQRDCISRGIDKLNLTGEDIITITDLDEIPNPNILTQIKNNIIIVGINIIELDLYYYNLNSKMDHKWYHSKILTFEKYKELNTGCDNIRFYNCPIINNAGWHLSYFGNEKFIKNKLENFTHQEFNMTEFTNEKQIEERIKNGKDLFDRPNSIIHINIEDNNNLPPDYDIYLKNYYNICYEDEKVEVKLNSNKKEMDLNKFNNGGGIFIQIGAGAGDLDERANCRDGFTELVKKLPRQSIKKIILVEPNPLNIPLLKKCWKDYPESIIYEIGIVPKNYQNNTIDLYYCPLDAPHYQVASINKSHVQKHYGDNCEIEKFIIPVKQLENFINEITTEEIDLLALDIEGIDSEILLDINFNNLKLKYLSFEHLHLGEYKENVLNHLKNNNYEFVGSGVDHNGYDYLYINGHYNKL